MTTLLTLPPHLQEAIQDLLCSDVDLPNDLRKELSRTNSNRNRRLSSPQSKQDRSLGSAETIIEIKDKVDDEPKRSIQVERLKNGHTISIENQDESDNSDVNPTIPHETLESLSRWASSDSGRRALGSNGLDRSRYSIISLLVGTEVYIPFNELERMRLAENGSLDRPNPYLPSYLSPNNPTTLGSSNGLGSEFRSLSKSISTILNILFSIFGSGAAVYVASTTGAGYSREISILLAVLTGFIVGIADAILVWIFTKKVEESRVERHNTGRKMLSGSGKLSETEENLITDGNEDDIQDEEDSQKGNEQIMKEKIGSSGVKKEIRLRRRGLNASIQ
ncbi:uncharacterized protein IL334_007288 [Kwoniella shivajii]|uniref:Endoplasmic reticulum-based factor for assembly of V-ATPase n=1 Tax=Kwoniella shivajii TaxID=564305 RepID=A0ABZ1D8R6_9TREE|nr:hypothetical protein IL334_007288 [Kwoniella shivajii]